MTRSAEYRRRERILADPDDGARFVRLSRADQDRVTALRGAAARRRLHELDAARRGRVRDQAAARRALSRQTVVDHVLDALGAVPTLRPVWPLTVMAGVALMRAADRTETLGMDGDDIKARAAEQNPSVLGYGERNPWWYH